MAQIGLWAQEGDSLSPPPVVVPTGPAIKIYTLANVLQQQQADISKYPLASYYIDRPNITTNKIERKYFTDNAFDIGAYDNPFALQGSKKKRNRSKYQQKQDAKSIFTDLWNLSEEDNDQRIPKWLIFNLLGILSFMTILLTLYRKMVGNIFQAFFSLGSASNLYREQRNFLKIESFSSYILFVLTMGTFCFILPQFFTENPPFNTFSGLLLCVIGVGLAYFLKYVQLRIVGIILPYPNEIGFYSFIVSITNKVIGYFLLPALFILAYVPDAAQFFVLYIILAILTIIYLYRGLRGLAIGANTILFHKFHFFIYLCTVEIAPVVILLKLLSIF